MSHLTTALFFAFWQSTFLLGLALLWGKLLQTTLRKTPWQTHQIYWYGIIAAVATPIFSTVVDVYDGGWLGGGMVVSRIPSPSGGGLGWGDYFGFAFLAGMTLFTLLLVRGIFSSRKLMFRAKPFPDRESQEALLRGSEMLQNLSLPILFTSPSVRSPTVWCWGLHPAVVLPDELASKLANEERDAIFLHELAHIARRDHLTAFFARICGLLLFWNPLYWLCLRQVDLLADEACDLMVLSKGNIAADTLAETLLRLAGPAVTDRSSYFYSLSTLQFLSRKETMMKRINTILDFGEGRNKFSVRPSRLWQCSAFLLMLTLSAALAFCQEKNADETKVADALIARFAKNDFGDAGFTQGMKEAQAGDIAKSLWQDFTKQFGKFVQSKAAKTEKVLEFKRVHEHCEFERGAVTFMVVVDKSNRVAGLFVMVVEEKDDFSQQTDTSSAWKTPEGAYTHLVGFAGAGDFAPKTPRELLDKYNTLTNSSDVRTGYFRTWPKDGRLIGAICTDSPDVLRKVIENAPELELIGVRPLNEKMFNTHQAKEQLSLQVDAEPKSKDPKIVKMEPANKAKDVDADAVTELRVTFDRDMAVGSHAWVTIGNGFPETTDPATWDGKRTAVLPVKLKPNETYRLALNMGRFRAFASEDGEFLKDTVYTFKTKPAKQAASANMKSSQKLAQEGWKLFMQGNAAEAVEKFEAATSANPKNANAYQGLGWAQMNSGEQEAAKTTFAKCIELDPKNVAALNGLGQIAYYSDEDEETAIAHWEKAISLDKRAGGPMAGLGNLYKNRGDKENALKYYKMWLKTEPQNEAANKAVEELEK